MFLPVLFLSPPLLPGDRSTERRDVKKMDTLDYMGHHTESYDPSKLPEEPLGDIFPIPEEGSDGLFLDINGNPSAGGVGGGPSRGELMGIFSAGSDGRSTANAFGPGVEGQPRGPSVTSSLSSPSMTPAAGQSRTQVAGAASTGRADGWGAEGTRDSTSAAAGASMEITQLLSQAEIERREAAVRAASKAQEAAARRAAWNAKSGLVS